MTVSVYKHFVCAVKGLVASERKQYSSFDHGSDESDVFGQMKSYPMDTLQDKVFLLMPSEI